MLFAQFVNLNDSPQTNGYLLSKKEEILYKASRESVGKAFNEPEDNSPHKKLPPIKRYNVVLHENRLSSSAISKLFQRKKKEIDLTSAVLHCFFFLNRRELSYKFNKLCPFFPFPFEANKLIRNELCFDGRAH